LDGQQTVDVDDPVVLVGFSPDNLADASKGSKRFGWNMIDRIRDDDRNEIWTSYRRKFTGAGISPGDSGGPLLKDCKVIGVASGASYFAGKTGWHTNLTNADNRKTLQKAALQGAYFCGLTGNDPLKCPPTALYRKIRNFTPYSREFPCDLY
jgi:hypothetical protein